MNRKQILLNAATTFAQVIGSAAALFLLYRFLIRAIGVERLGVWSLVLATTSVVTLANQGLSTSIVKFVAKYVAREEPERVSVLVQTALISIGAALAILSLGLYPAAKWALQFILPGPHLSEAVAILPCALISLWINILASVLQAGLAGHELVTHRNYVVFGGSVLYLLLAFALVPRHGLLGLAYAQVINAGAGFAAGWLLLRRRIPGLPLIPRRFNRVLFQEMLHYGAHFQFITAGQSVREPVTKALLAKFGGLAMTGFYDMAMRWVITFRELIVQANQVLVPTVANLQERDPAALPRIYRDSYRLIFFLSVPASAVLVALSPVVSHIWLGRYEPVFVHLVALLAAAWLVNILANPAYVMDLGTGRLRWVTAGCATTGILNLVLGYFAGKYFGGMAVAIAAASSLAIGYTIVLFAYHAENRISLRELWPPDSARIAATSAAGVALCFPLFRAFIGHAAVPAWSALALAAGLLGIVATPMWMHPMRKRLMQWAFARIPAGAKNA
ncbi:MAG: lipopolysaccharide biosynthesis protein [Candidatus Acidiferrales bacterium]